MIHSSYLLLTPLCLLLSHPRRTVAVDERRDPLRWPFAEDSIWNTPIGDQAVYVEAQIRKRERRGMTIDEDIIVLKPNVPHTKVYYSDVGWTEDGSGLRCTNYSVNRPLFELPIPEDFVVSPETWDGLRPNSGLACLLPDGETIVQTQPFAKCRTNVATSLTSSAPRVNIYTGDGIRGAHGGSGLSAIGGTIRVGELLPGGVIRHALKINLYGRFNLHSEGYRWPAVKADTGFDDVDSGNYYGGSNPDLVMGSLVALHEKEDLLSLTENSLGIVTEPALILARAFQDYGAYVVDNTAWDVYAIVTEWGPDGRVEEEVKKHWGYGISQDSKDTDFSKDMDRIFLNLHVIANNGPNSIGGGGQPRAPLAPPFQEEEDRGSGGLSLVALLLSVLSSGVW